MLLRRFDLSYGEELKVAKAVSQETRRQQSQCKAAADYLRQEFARSNRADLTVHCLLDSVSLAINKDGNEIRRQHVVQKEAVEKLAKELLGGHTQPMDTEVDTESADPPPENPPAAGVPAANTQRQPATTKETQ